MRTVERNAEELSLTNPEMSDAAAREIHVQVEARRSIMLVKCRKQQVRNGRETEERLWERLRRSPLTVIGLQGPSRGVVRSHTL